MKRLIAFALAIIPTNAAIAQEPSIDLSGNWSVYQAVSAMTDEPTVGMGIESSTEIECGFTINPAPISLYLRCIEDTTSVMINTQCLLSSHNGGNQITYRIDDNPAETHQFDMSSDSKSIGLRQGSTAIPFIKSMFNGHTLLVRFFDMTGNKIETSFNISDLETQITPFREACHW